MIAKKPTRDKAFIDSNILIYLCSYDEAYKRDAAEGLLNFSEYHITLSTQVINEFVSVMKRKRCAFADALISTIEDLYSCFHVSRVRLRTIKAAIHIPSKYRYSYFDSLMVASALEKKCTVLFSEDMHNGHIIERRLRILNPFIDSPKPQPILKQAEL